MRHRNSRSVGHGALDRPPKGAGQSAETQSAIPDVLGRHLRVLFCGINPGRVSAAARAHFANPRNDFWRLLHEAGFTRRLLTPAEQWLALDDGVGVTNAAHRTTPGSSDLRGADFAGSAERLERLARDFEPVWLAFVGKEAYRGAFKERPAAGCPGSDARPAHATLRPAVDLTRERCGPVGGTAALVRGTRAREPARRASRRSRDPARPSRPCLPPPLRPPGRPGRLDHSRRRARRRRVARSRASPRTRRRAATRRRRPRALGLVAPPRLVLARAR